MKRLRRRYGHAGGRGGKGRGVPSHITLERASDDAQRNANTTRTPWVVVYRPRDGSHWAYNLPTLRRAPINEPHEIVATFHPQGA